MRFSIDLKHIKQWIINRFNTDYVENFEKATIYTRQLGLEVPNFEYDPGFNKTDQSKQEIGGLLTHYFYTHEKLNLERMAGLCMVRSKEAQLILKEFFDIDSVITSGGVYDFNYCNVFHEPKSITTRRIQGRYLGPFGFHTWLTLPNYDVIDVTLTPALWVQYDKRISREEDYQNILWSQPLIDRKPFLYKPMFLGYDYFRKTPTVAQLRTVKFTE